MYYDIKLENIKIQQVTQNMNHLEQTDGIEQTQDTIKMTTSMGTMGVIGGMGSLSMCTTLTVAGTVVCAAAYGAKKAIEQKDISAMISVASGAFTGAGISAIVGGIGLVIAESAVSVSVAPMVVAGGTIGLAGYGLTKLVQQITIEGIESIYPLENKGIQLWRKNPKKVEQTLLK